VDRFKRLAALAKLQIEKGRSRWGWFDVAFRTFKRFGEDDGGSYTAALTYYTFFSIIPLIVAAGAILGYVTFGNESLKESLVASGLKTIPILKDALSPEGLKTIEENRQGLAVTGTLLALYTGSGVIVAMEHALNKIMHIQVEPNFFVQRLRSLRWLAILGLGAVVSLGLSVVTGFAPGPLAVVLTLAGGLALNTGLFATAFKFLPGKDSAWSEVLPGAIVAAVAFEILKVAGSAYLARGESARNDTFGTFAATAALLIASHLIAQIILLSAELNAVLAERRITRQSLTTT
jgi:YihY family inner membrane protein